MTRARSKRARTHKRNLFAELTEGMSALAQARQGRRTLRTHAVDFKPAPEVTPRELVRVRQRLKVSRGLFAAYLRTNVRTLENRERAGESQCAGGVAHQSRETLPGYGRAARHDLNDSSRAGACVDDRRILTQRKPQLGDGTAHLC